MCPGTLQLQKSWLKGNLIPLKWLAGLPEGEKTRYLKNGGIMFVLLLNVYCEHLLYPRHLCRGVYSFRLSVRPFVCLYVRSFVCSFVLPSVAWNLRQSFASKFCVKVSQVVYISATTHQKAFIFGP